jgi:ArsR family transcriptional regulator, arsenate/arsenite/antimonite-responsive transcriptional repressor
MQIFPECFGKKELPPASRAMISLHLDDSMNRSEIDKISKALADETRLRIFEAISAGKQMTCGDIVSMRGVTPATVSHHLKILSEAGLISCRREGQFVYSHAIPETISAYSRALAKIAQGKKAPRRR